jgi:hypothetical protein
MAITGGFGFMIDIATGKRRRWYYDGKNKIKRWLDNDEPCDPQRVDRGAGERIS